MVCILCLNSMHALLNAPHITYVNYVCVYMSVYIYMCIYVYIICAFLVFKY